MRSSAEMPYHIGLKVKIYRKLPPQAHSVRGGLGGPKKAFCKAKPSGTLE